MKAFRFILPFFAGLCFAVNPAPYAFDINSRQSTAPSLEGRQGEQKQFLVTFYDGTNRSDISGNTPFMYWASNGVASLYVTSSWSFVDSGTGGVALFTFAAQDFYPNMTGVNYDAWYGVGVGNTYRSGSLRFISNPRAGGAPTTNFIMSTNLAGITFVNAPWIQSVGSDEGSTNAVHLNGTDLHVSFKNTYSTSSLYSISSSDTNVANISNPSGAQASITWTSYLTNAIAKALLSFGWGNHSTNGYQNGAQVTNAITSANALMTLSNVMDNGSTASHDLNMNRNSITNIGTNSLDFADGVFIHSTNVTAWNLISTAAVKSVSSSDTNVASVSGTQSITITWTSYLTNALARALTAFGWGNHATNGYQTGSQVTNYMAKTGGVSSSGTRIVAADASEIYAGSDGTVDIRGGEEGLDQDNIHIILRWDVADGDPSVEFKPYQGVKLWGGFNTNVWVNEGRFIATNSGMVSKFYAVDAQNVSIISNRAESAYTNNVLTSNALASLRTTFGTTSNAFDSRLTTVETGKTPLVSFVPVSTNYVQLSSTGVQTIAKSVVVNDSITALTNINAIGGVGSELAASFSGNLAANYNFIGSAYSNNGSIVVNQNQSGGYVPVSQMAISGSGGSYEIRIPVSGVVTQQVVVTMGGRTNAFTYAGNGPITTQTLSNFKTINSSNLVVTVQGAAAQISFWRPSVKRYNVGDLSIGGDGYIGGGNLYGVTNIPGLLGIGSNNFVNINETRDWLTSGQIRYFKNSYTSGAYKPLQLSGPAEEYSVNITTNGAGASSVFMYLENNVAQSYIGIDTNGDTYITTGDQALNINTGVGLLNWNNSKILTGNIVRCSSFTNGGVSTFVFPGATGSISGATATLYTASSTPGMSNVVSVSGDVGRQAITNADVLETFNGNYGVRVDTSLISYINPDSRVDQWNIDGGIFQMLDAVIAWSGAGSLLLSTNLQVLEDLTVGSNLSVSGAATFTGVVDIDTSASINSADVVHNLTVGGTNAIGSIIISGNPASDTYIASTNNLKIGTSTGNDLILVQNSTPFLTKGDSSLVISNANDIKFFATNDFSINAKTLTATNSNGGSFQINGADFGTNNWVFIVKNAQFDFGTFDDYPCNFRQNGDRFILATSNRVDASGTWNFSGHINVSNEFYAKSVSATTSTSSRAWTQFTNNLPVGVWLTNENLFAVNASIGVVETRAAGVGVTGQIVVSNATATAIYPISKGALTALGNTEIENIFINGIDSSAKWGVFDTSGGGSSISVTNTTFGNK